MRFRLFGVGREINAGAAFGFADLDALHDHGPLRPQFKALKIPDTPLYSTDTGEFFLLRAQRQHD